MKEFKDKAKNTPIYEEYKIQKSKFYKNLGIHYKQSKYFDDASTCFEEIRRDFDLDYQKEENLKYFPIFSEAIDLSVQSYIKDDKWLLAWNIIHGQCLKYFPKDTSGNIFFNNSFNKLTKAASNVDIPFTFANFRSEALRIILKKTRDKPLILGSLSLIVYLEWKHNISGMIVGKIRSKYFQNQQELDKKSGT